MSNSSKKLDLIKEYRSNPDINKQKSLIEFIKEKEKTIKENEVKAINEIKPQVNQDNTNTITPQKSKIELIEEWKNKPLVYDLEYYKGNTEEDELFKEFDYTEYLKYIRDKKIGL